MEPDRAAAVGLPLDAVDRLQDLDVVPSAGHRDQPRMSVVLSQVLSQCRTPRAAVVFLAFVSIAVTTLTPRIEQKVRALPGSIPCPGDKQSSETRSSASG